RSGATRTVGTVTRRRRGSRSALAAAACASEGGADVVAKVREGGSGVRVRAEDSARPLANARIRPSKARFVPFVPWPDESLLRAELDERVAMETFDGPLIAVLVPLLNRPHRVAPLLPR